MLAAESKSLKRFSTSADSNITTTPAAHLVCEGSPAYDAAGSPPACAIPGGILRHGCPQCRAVDVHGPPIRQLCCDLQLRIRVGLAGLPATACPIGAFSRCHLVCNQQLDHKWLVAASYMDVKSSHFDYFVHDSAPSRDINATGCVLATC